jgi:hypothetical protein
MQAVERQDPQDDDGGDSGSSSADSDVVPAPLPWPEAPVNNAEVKNERPPDALLCPVTTVSSAKCGCRHLMC